LSGFFLFKKKKNKKNNLLRLSAVNLGKTDCHVRAPGHSGLCCAILPARFVSPIAIVVQKCYIVPDISQAPPDGVLSMILAARIILAVLGK